MQEIKRTREVLWPLVTGAAGRALEAAARAARFVPWPAVAAPAPAPAAAAPGGGLPEGNAALRQRLVAVFADLVEKLFL